MFKNKRILTIISSVFMAVMLLILLVSPAFGEDAQGKGDPQGGQFGQPHSITYNLYATDGLWTMADGTQIYSYGFIGGRTGDTITYLDTKSGTNAPKIWKVVPPTPGTSASAPEAALAGYAQFPAPLIYAGVGDPITITLKNLGITNNNAAGNDPHTVHLHGLDVDVANDGVPETSVAAIPAGPGTAEFPLSPGAGNIVVYMFTPKVAGTYFYHCHQEADIHVTMGMYGALVIYNRTDPGRFSGPGSSGTQFGFHYDKDYVLLLSDTDVNQHLSEGGMDGTGLGFQNFSGAAGSFNPVDYHPEYWFINGLSFPETIHASGTNFDYTNWIKAHPGYDPMIVGSVGAKHDILVRMINMGYETQPMHMHGFHAKVIGKDQRAWTWANNPNTPTGLGLEENTVTIGSGEEYELLFDFSTQRTTSQYPDQPTFGSAGGGTESRYNSNGPQSNTKTTATPIPDPDGNPYIAGPTVKGAVGLGGTSQIFVFHNHDDYKATNNGVYPGGMFTILVPVQ